MVYATVDLLQKAQSGDEEAKSKLVEDNFGLVWSLVHRFKNSRYDNEDLFQIGCMGLVKAINNFDFSYNVQFSTYAVPIILGEIKRFFRDDGCIKVSRSIKELNLKIQKEKEKYWNLHNEEISIETLANLLSVSNEDIVIALDSSSYPTSLSEPIFEKDGSSINLEDSISVDQHELEINKLTLEDEIAKLDKRERLILELRYNLDLNQEEIAKRLGISQVQVSRLEKKIIDKLRKQLVV